MKLWIMCYTFFVEDQVNIYLELNFSELYTYGLEKISSNMSDPKGGPVSITTFFDADHTNGIETRLYFPGVIIFLTEP